MVVFDHREPGTDESAWRPALREVPRRGVPDVVRAVVLAPHPDDETLGSGGLIARLARTGIAVRVVFATSGERGGEDDGLGARREEEARVAMHVLAPDAEIVFLGLPDGGLREERAALTGLLRGLLGDDPGRTLLCAPWSGDGHRDHRIAGEIAAALADELDLAAHWQYPVWLWHWGDPRSLSGLPLVALDLDRAERAVKRAALAAYRSQVEASGPAAGPILHARMLAHFDRPEEVHIVIR